MSREFRWLILSIGAAASGLPPLMILLTLMEGHEDPTSVWLHAAGNAMVLGAVITGVAGFIRRTPTLLALASLTIAIISPGYALSGLSAVVGIGALAFLFLARQWRETTLSRTIAYGAAVVGIAIALWTLRMGASPAAMAFGIEALALAVVAFWPRRLRAPAVARPVG